MADEPTYDEIFDEALRQYGTDALRPFHEHIIDATRDTSWHKPESKVDEATKLWQKLNAAALEASGPVDCTMDAEMCRQGQFDHLPTAQAAIAVLRQYLADRDAKHEAELDRVFEEADRVMTEVDYDDKALWLAFKKEFGR